MATQFSSLHSHLFIVDANLPYNENKPDILHESILRILVVAQEQKTVQQITIRIKLMMDR
ncbi:hypothetical protein ANAEL_02056 [Anaerolineales bacterium]|nr:hypothetical protein ANAEL_02056 [Anaerolineales bacterium]